LAKVIFTKSKPEQDMETAYNTFNTVHGPVTVALYIFVMGRAEAVDVYALDSFRFGCGGWRIDGVINGTPIGTRFYPNGIFCSSYFGGDTEDVAREFLAAARQDGH
jgi:hypothetical protein